DHFFTIDPAERDRALANGYHAEGIACYLPSEGFDLIAPHQLAERFHQLFSELPLACEEVDERVRQVRIAIEVLRAKVAADSTTLSAAFHDQEAQYRTRVYDALLRGFGTSSIELRGARGAASAVRKSLADRLQIEPDSPTRDYLDELTLDAPSASELDIERLFGLVDTN